MLTLLVTLFSFAAVMAAMAIGVMVTGRRLQGSCGGIANGSSCLCKAKGLDPTKQACARLANAAPNIRV